MTKARTTTDLQSADLQSADLLSADWLFLRGLGRHGKHWGDFPKLFQERFASARVHLADLAGNGTEAQRESFLQVLSYVDDLRARLQPLPEKGFALFAMSLGGMVASAWARAYPEEVRALVLVNSSAKDAGPFWQRLRARNYLEVIRLFRESANIELRENVILKITAPTLSPAEREDLAHRYSAMRTTTPHNFIRQIMAASQYYLPTRPDVPILVLAANGDRLVDYRCSKQIAQKWNAPIAIHPGEDHDLPLTEPHWVLDEIQKFLAQK